MPPKNAAPEPTVTISSGGTTTAPEASTADLKLQIANLTDLVNKLIAAQPAPAQSAQPLPFKLADGVVRVRATKDGTYPNVDPITGKKVAGNGKVVQSYYRNGPHGGAPGDEFFCLESEASWEPVNPSDASHGWMVRADAPLPPPAADVPMTPISQTIPDPLASVQSEKPTAVFGNQGYVQR